MDYLVIGKVLTYFESNKKLQKKNAQHRYPIVAFMDLVFGPVIFVFFFRKKTLCFKDFLLSDFQRKFKGGI